MPHNQRFLVALSMTEQDYAILNYASELARSGVGREFRFVHVQTPSLSAARQVSPAEAQTNLEDIVQRHFGTPPDGVLTSCHVAAAERVDGLLEFCTRTRADFVLLGHRRTRSGQRSLARRLAMIAPCSVWMVPEGAPHTIRRILAPVDFSDHSADSLTIASSLGRVLGAEQVLALHVAFDPMAPHYEEVLEQRRHDEEDAFAQFLAKVDNPGVKIARQTEESPDAANAILRVADNQHADLIVMSTRGRSRAAAILLGSVTTQVMVETKVAVVAVKHFGAMMGLFQAIKDSHFWSRPNPKAN